MEVKKREKTVEGGERGVVDANLRARGRAQSSLRGAVMAAGVLGGIAGVLVFERAREAEKGEDGKERLREERDRVRTRGSELLEKGVRGMVAGCSQPKERWPPSRS